MDVRCVLDIASGNCLTFENFVSSETTRPLARIYMNTIAMAAYAVNSIYDIVLAFMSSA
jgi:hypothetical protein